MKKFLLLPLLLITASLYSVTSSQITFAKSAKTLSQLQTICEQKNSLPDLDNAASTQFYTNYGTTPSAACATLPDLQALNAMPVTNDQQAIDFLEALTQLAENQGPIKLVDQTKYTDAQDIINSMPAALSIASALTAQQKANLDGAIDYLKARAGNRGTGAISGFTYDQTGTLKSNIQKAINAISQSVRNVLNASGFPYEKNKTISTQVEQVINAAKTSTQPAPQTKTTNRLTKTINEIAQKFQSPALSPDVFVEELNKAFNKWANASGYVLSNNTFNDFVTGINSGLFSEKNIFDLLQGKIQQVDLPKDQTYKGQKTQQFKLPSNFSYNNNWHVVNNMIAVFDLVKKPPVAPKTGTSFDFSVIVAQHNAIGTSIMNDINNIKTIVTGMTPALRKTQSAIYIPELNKRIAEFNKITKAIGRGNGTKIFENIKPGNPATVKYNPQDQTYTSNVKLVDYK